MIVSTPTLAAMRRRAPRCVTARASKRNTRRARRETKRPREDASEGASPSPSMDLDEVEASVFDRDGASAPRAPEPVKIEAMKEIESVNARLAPGAAKAREEAFRAMMAREKMREDNRSPAERALSVDSLLVFGCDGVLPEIVNARVAMFGVLTGTVVEVTTGKSFAEQLGWNLTHGVSAFVVGAVIVASCLPSFLAKADGETVFGSGACKWKRDTTARAERGYLVDPLNLDVRTLPGKDTVLGRIGWVPFVELLNGRLAMLTLIVLFAGEPLAGHPFFTAP